MMNPFTNLPEELILDQALQLDLEDINNFCQTDVKFNKLVCNNENFWRARYLQDYGKVDSVWKNLYLDRHDNEIVNEVALTPLDPDEIFIYHHENLAYRLGKRNRLAAALSTFQSSGEWVQLIIGYSHSDRYDYYIAINLIDNILSRSDYFFYEDELKTLLENIKHDSMIKVLIRAMKWYDRNITISPDLNITPQRRAIIQEIMDQ